MNFTMDNNSGKITRFEYSGNRMIASRLINSSLLLYHIKISKTDTIEMFTKVCNVITKMSDKKFKEGSDV